MSLLNEVRKLEDAHNQKLETLARKEAKLAKREKALAEKEARFNSENESLDLKIEQNTVLVGKILNDEKLKEKASDLEELHRQVKASKKELRLWENRLFQIEKNQEEKEAKLIKDRVELTEAKKTYKEELKEQFFKELENRVASI
jgi:hypothetical protein